jgi:glycosyltransferase involved in cell wall biosynthesis
MADGAQPPADVLQIAPNDHPPFGDILTIYQRALTSLGARVETLVLAPARGTPVSGCTYLNLTDLGDVRSAGRRVREAVSGSPRLALCHRYRAYRVLRASGLAVPRKVAIAHEFGFFKRFQRRLERRLFARDVIFAGVSPAVQAELAEAVPDPLCLPNALDLETVRQTCLSSADARDRLGIAESDALTIGLVGRLVQKKSPELAIEAIRALVGDQVPVRLLVIGDGPLRGDLEQRAQDLPVTFLGFVPDAKRLFKALDLLLLTSQKVEAFGMVALEAMCAGVPVVAGPTPGPQYVLGSTGFYYNQREPAEIADAIRSVILARQAGEFPDRAGRALERAEREFSVSALARRLAPLV